MSLQGLLTHVKTAQEVETTDKVAATRELISELTEEEFKEVFKEAAEEPQGDAPEGDAEVTEEDVKTAEELYAAGQIMAEGFRDALGQE